MPQPPRHGDDAPIRAGSLYSVRLLLCCLLPVIGLVSPVKTKVAEAQAQSAFENAVPTNQPPFPSPATPKLAANFQVTVSGQSLRELLQSIQNSTRLPILLDRRIDPSGPAISQSLSPGTPSSSGNPSPRLDPQADAQAEPVMRPTNLGPTLQEALDRLVAARQASQPNPPRPSKTESPRPLEWASAGELVLVGPVNQTTAAATEILSARTRLQPHLARYQAKAVSWPELTTPAEALAVVADTWNLDVSKLDLPHDLWPAVELGEIHVTTALGVIASQFGQHFELDFDSGTVRSRPLRGEPVVRLRYPLLELTNAQRDSIVQTGAKLLKRENQWELTGNAAAHFQLELSIFKRGKTGRTSGRAVLKFSFKFIGTVGDALTNLCQAGNMRLEASELTEQQKGLRIELEAKNKSIEEILQEVARRAKLRISFADDRVTVTPAE